MGGEKAMCGVVACGYGAVTDEADSQTVPPLGSWLRVGVGLGFGLGVGAEVRNWVQARVWAWVRARVWAWLGVGARV